MSAKEKAAAGTVLLLVLLLPAPILPPNRLAEALQSLLGIGWKPAYLAAAIGLRVFLYGSLGVLAAFSLPPASTQRGRWLQLICAPLVVVSGALVIRLVKLGHVLPPANLLLPMLACFLGMGLGLLFKQSGWRTTSLAGGLACAVLIWIAFPDVSSRLNRETRTRLQQLVAAAAKLPAGEDRFGVLCQAAFSPGNDASMRTGSIEGNRAAILALGIALGHEQLARFGGLDGRDPLVREAVAARQGTALHGRSDLVRHFCLSAALTILQNPWVSDAGGLAKEELDALARGSGFSFADLTADRAGVRFATCATDSESSAKAVRERLQRGLVLDDFFPPIADLPENLTLEQFRLEFGGVGHALYRQKLREIEERLDKCPGLVILPSP